MNPNDQNGNDDDAQDDPTASSSSSSTPSSVAEAAAAFNEMRNNNPCSIRSFNIFGYARRQRELESLVLKPNSRIDRLSFYFDGWNDDPEDSIVTLK